MEKTEFVLSEILNERRYQLAKWGEESHQYVTLKVFRSDDIQAEIPKEYGIPTEDQAKQRLNKAVENEDLSWAHILVEEVSEAIASAKDPNALRSELIQVAAVATAWIEQIDRDCKLNLKANI